MNIFVWYLIAPASYDVLQFALSFVRIGIGILTIGHGAPKIFGGVATWSSVGQAMGVLGIHFLPVLWGLLAACTEFFGGILLVLGFGTRLVAVFQIFLLFIAFLMHYKQGDSFAIYSHALALMIIFAGFVVAGSGPLSIDFYLSVTRPVV